VERFANSEKTEHLELVANALFNKGVALGAWGKTEEAILAYNQVVERFGKSDKSELLEVVESALMNKSSTLANLERYKEALETCDAALHIQPQNPFAIMYRVLLLIDLKLEDDAIHYAKEIIHYPSMDTTIKTLMSFQLLQRSMYNISLLKSIRDIYKEDVSSLIGGLISLIRSWMPISEKGAKDLEKAEENLWEVFEDIPEAKNIIDILNASRRSALGDQKALMEIPLELRQLIIGKENSNKLNYT